MMRWMGTVPGLFGVVGAPNVMRSDLVIKHGAQFSFSITHGKADPQHALPSGITLKLESQNRYATATLTIHGTIDMQSQH